MRMIRLIALILGMGVLASSASGKVECCFRYDEGVAKYGGVKLGPEDSIPELCGWIATKRNQPALRQEACRKVQLPNREVVTTLPYDELTRLFTPRRDGVGYEAVTLAQATTPRASLQASAPPPPPAKPDTQVEELKRELADVRKDNEGQTREVGRLQEKLANLERERNTLQGRLEARERASGSISTWFESWNVSQDQRWSLLFGILLVLLILALILWLVYVFRQSDKKGAEASSHPRAEPQADLVARAEAVRQDKAELERLRGVEARLATATIALEAEKQKVAGLTAQGAEAQRFKQEKEEAEARTREAETRLQEARAQVIKLQDLYFKERDEVVPALKAEKSAVEAELAVARAEIKRMSQYVLGWSEQCELPARLFSDEEKGSSMLELWRTDGRLQQSLDKTAQPDIWCVYRLAGKFPNGADNTVQGNLDGSLDCALVLQALRTSPDLRQEVEQKLGRTFKPVSSV